MAKFDLTDLYNDKEMKIIRKALESKHRLNPFYPNKISNLNFYIFH